jgi:hypothetical protein
MTDPLDLRAMAERLQEARERIGAMCSEGRPPRMSIPADRLRDDDLFICDVLRDAEALLASQASWAELERKLNELTRHIDHYREVESVSKGATYKDLVPVTHREAEMERQLAAIVICGDLVTQASESGVVIAGPRAEGYKLALGALGNAIEAARHASLPLAAKGE